MFKKRSKLPRKISTLRVPAHWLEDKFPGRPGHYRAKYVARKKQDSNRYDVFIELYVEHFIPKYKLPFTKNHQGGYSYRDVLQIFRREENSFLNTAFRYYSCRNDICFKTEDYTDLKSKFLKSYKPRFSRSHFSRFTLGN